MGNLRPDRAVAHALEQIGWRRRRQRPACGGIVRESRDQGLAEPQLELGNLVHLEGPGPLDVRRIGLEQGLVAGQVGVDQQQRHIV